MIDIMYHNVWTALITAISMLSIPRLFPAFQLIHGTSLPLKMSYDEEVRHENHR